MLWFISGVQCSDEDDDDDGLLLLSFSFFPAIAIGLLLKQISPSRYPKIKAEREEKMKCINYS